MAVCLKHSIDETELRLDRDSGRVILEDAKTKIGEADKAAIEEAVRIKERHGGRITALTMGPLEAKKAIREALAMGCDEAYLLSDSAFEDSDTLATARILSYALEKLGGFDTVLLGEATTDGYSGQVGPGVAELLNVPIITYARKITLEGSRVLAERSLEEGIELVEASMPLVISVSREINEPRLPTLAQILAASRKPIQTWDAAALQIDIERVGAKGSMVRVLNVQLPKSQRKKIIFEGDPKEVAKRLALELIREGVIG